MRVVRSRWETCLTVDVVIMSPASPIVSEGMPQLAEEWPGSIGIPLLWDSAATQGDAMDGAKPRGANRCYPEEDGRFLRRKLRMQGGSRRRRGGERSSPRGW